MPPPSGVRLEERRIRDSLGRAGSQLTLMDPRAVARALAGAGCICRTDVRGLARDPSPDVFAREAFPGLFEVAFGGLGALFLACVQPAGSEGDGGIAVSA